MADRPGVTLAVNEAGTRPPELAGADVAFLTGCDGSALKELPYTDRQRQALHDYAARGGFLWAEATAGSVEFDAKFLKLAADMKWTVEPLPKDHPIMTGLFATAAGRNITRGLEFRRALKIARLGRPRAELAGIYQDGRLVGIYSPFDVVFSTTGYPAYGCRGYAAEDAKAVAANILLYLTNRPER